jgi:hypothetical protein
MSIADILPPPNDSRKNSQTSNEAQKAARNLETSRISQSRISQNSSRVREEGLGLASPGKYRQIRENLRARRDINTPPPLPRSYNLRQGSSKVEITTPPSKLPGWTIFWMVLTAVLIDIGQILIQFIPVLGQALSVLLNVIFGLGFYIWFKLHGVNMASTRKALTFFGGGLLDSFSIGILPAWTIDIILIIVFERLEEKVLAKNPLAEATLNKLIK